MEILVLAIWMGIGFLVGAYLTKEDLRYGTTYTTLDFSMSFIFSMILGPCMLIILRRYLK